MNVSVKENVFDVNKWAGRSCDWRKKHAEHVWFLQCLYERQHWSFKEQTTTPAKVFLVLHIYLFLSLFVVCMLAFQIFDHLNNKKKNIYSLFTVVSE